MLEHIKYLEEETIKLGGKQFLEPHFRPQSFACPFCPLNFELAAKKMYLCFEESLIASLT